MRWIKWTMVAVAGVLPTMVRAEEPPARDDKPINLKLDVQPLKDENQKIFEIGGENSPFYFKIEKGTFPLQLVGEATFVLGDVDPQDQKAQMDLVKGQLQHLLKSAVHVKGSYLGVSATPPPPVLRKQLGLADGMGLVVEFVMPESPAAKAGIQQYDVLQKLEDQLIVNQEQFAVLVRSHKPGDEVKLTIIRDGKPQTVTAKLAEHDIEPLAEEGGANRIWTDVLAENPQHGPFGPGPVQGGFMKEWRANVFPVPGGPSKSVTWLEGDRFYSIVTDNEGHKTYTVKDKDGKSLFHGPIDTPEQREKLSPEMKEKLQQLEKRMEATIDHGGFKSGGAIGRPNPPVNEKKGEEK